jgi:DNA-binding response OmpR family regulator
VSRPHAEIESVAPGEFTVRDLKSRNGTLVNGDAIEGQVRVSGQPTVQVGPYLLKLASLGEESSNTVTVAPDRVRARMVTLDRGQHSVMVGGRIVIERLGGLEFRLIDYLDTNAPNVVSNTEIGDHLWSEGQWDVYMLHNLVRRFRRRLEEQELDANACLVTIPGVGYRLA